jgi:ArsR family metal-binding transcriptional regulator
MDAKVAGMQILSEGQNDMCVSFAVVVLNNEVSLTKNVALKESLGVCK